MSFDYGAVVVKQSFSGFVSEDVRSLLLWQGQPACIGHHLLVFLHSLMCEDGKVQSAAISSGCHNAGDNDDYRGDLPVMFWSRNFESYRYILYSLRLRSQVVLATIGILQ